MGRFIRWFDEIGLQDVAAVGGKNASLGELYRELRPQGVPIPNGFAVTADAFWYVLDQAGIRQTLDELLAGVDKNDVADLAIRGQQARDLVLAAGLPEDLWLEIRDAYDQLGAKCGRDRLDVAVRSSATAEDLPGASFAGQQESYLNVHGHTALQESVRRCLASLYTDRAIAYRIDQGFADAKVGLSVCVQQMVRSDLASSGVMFTLDTETGFPDVVLLTAGYGLGENIVQGTIAPDEFYVFKPTLTEGKRPILRKRLGAKQLRMVYAEGTAGVHIRNVAVSDEDRAKFALDDDDVLTLARYAVQIERHYSGKAGQWRPMDIEWAKDGRTGELFIVQARPETVQAQRSLTSMSTYRLQGSGEVLVTGRSIGQKIGQGPARVITDLSQLSQFRPGEVLVADTTTPDWEPVMKQAAAIVTNRGGRTCHAAIVARELGIPAVVGTEKGTERLATGQVVTVSCAEGEEGKVYEGTVPFAVETIDLSGLGRPRTHVQMNVGDPDQAFGLAMLPNDGVGLARMEFIINHAIQIHPMALLHPERVTEPAAQVAVAAMTSGYADKAEYFVERLAQGIGTIAAAFFPKQVVVRLSDFKSNEYARLVGGGAFEPDEENPMLGFRGAARYSHPAYAEAFALECRALQRVRQTMGLTNVVVMVPFCRTVGEGERAIATMAAHGLVRGQEGLEIYMMCEIPNNVVQIDAFSQLYDGFSIGSNDLTQLVLGVDRDSAMVASEFDERDPGVLEMLRQAITGARRNNRHIGICGQAPSDFPEVAEFLVRQGIDAISLNPDTVVATTRDILAVEKAIGGQADRQPLVRG